MTERTFRKIVRASAIYDLAVTAPLAFPWSFAWVLSMFQRLHNAFGLSGTVPAYSAELALFANLMGSLVIVWSVLRVWTPEPRFGRFDAVGRALFSCWQVFAVLHGVSAILAGFLVFEVLWGVAQTLPYASERRADALETFPSTLRA